jgi:spermidine synthase
MMRAVIASRLPLLLVAIVSGAAALLYQTVWLREFGLLFGNTAYAASATLCAFFLGLALGAALVGAWSGASRRPLVLYARIEIGAALLALAFPFVLRAYDPIYARLYEDLADRRPVFVAVKFALALAAMLPASTLLGGTLPPLVSAYLKRGGALGREGGWLYAANTLGAALGSAAGALWLPEVIGVRATYATAVALSLVAAAAALALSRQDRVSDAPAAAAAPAAATGGPDGTRAGTAPRGLLGVAFVSGFGTLAFEVLLIHALAQTLDSSVYSFGAVLVVVLVALTAGALAVSFGAERVPARTLLPLALAAVALLLFVLPAALVAVTGGLSRYVSGSLFHGLALAGALGGPALFAGALVLPLTFRLAEGGSVGARLGGLLAANTLGGILGSVTASFVLLDRIGLWSSLPCVGILYAGTALATAASPRMRAGCAAAVALALAAVFLSPASPRRLPLVAISADERLLALEEGAHGVVSVLESDDGNRRIKVNNHYSLGGSRARVGAERAGLLPLLLHPAPKRALFVGAATGGTAAGAVLLPLDEIVLVEIVPEVQALAAEHFGPFTRGLHHDPRTRLVVEDGRNHLRATRERYDVVVADLFVPWHPGAGSMYTREHFEAVRARLSPGGVFCQWLPLYQLGSREIEVIAATFFDVFPNATLWRGDFFGSRPTAALIGSTGAWPSARAVEAAASDLTRLGVEDRWFAQPFGLWMLYVGPLAGIAPRLRDVPRNTDDHPLFEFLAGRSSAATRDAFLDRGWPELAAEVRDAAGLVDSAFPGRAPEAARAAAALARASWLHSQGRERELAPVLAEVAARIPAALLAPPPDGSAAEVWPRGAR